VPLAQRACARCGETFQPRNSAHRYCSDACREEDEAWRRKVRLAERACAQCGATYTPVSSNQRYCRKQCARRAGYLRRKPEAKLTTATCDQCGQAFAYVRKGTHRHYCSDACRREAKNARRRRRRRQRKKEPDAGPKPKPAPASSFPQGSLVANLRPLADWEPELFCVICGRPADDTWPGWSIRTYRRSHGGEETRVVVCPAHAGTSTWLIDRIIERSLWPRQHGGEADHKEL
jgi:endogenous inhibitor of DNA gyrase (YacG/DUF329 family)